MVDKDTTIYFRYKKEDRIVYCAVYPEKLWDDGREDDNCVYVDMDDDFLKGLINALKSMPTYEEPLDEKYKKWREEYDNLKDSF